ncbi:MAG: Holliday junction branch migration protein RuvA [Woeseia sp.]
MIGSIRGRLAFKQPPQVILDCSGVGYEIETPMSTFLDLPPIGSEVFLHTHLQVREDAHTLFGFATEQEKSLFRLLLKVNGVGARMALAILSGMGVADFYRAVQYEDTASLTRIPGIGRKTAERLIIEMRDRIDKQAGAVQRTAGGMAVTHSPRGEAFDALVALGYKPQEVKKLMEQLDIDDKSAEDIIRAALRKVAG